MRVNVNGQKCAYLAEDTSDWVARRLVTISGQSKSIKTTELPQCFAINDGWYARTDVGTVHNLYHQSSYMVANTTMRTCAAKIKKTVVDTNGIYSSGPTGMLEEKTVIVFTNLVLMPCMLAKRRAAHTVCCTLIDLYKTPLPERLMLGRN